MRGSVLNRFWHALRRSATAVWREVGAHLPGWYLAYQAISIAYTEAKVYVPPPVEYLWTAVFPLGWFYLYRIPLTAHAGTRRMTKALMLMVVPVALLIYSVTYALPYPLDRPTALHYTELWSFAAFAVLAIHCLVRGGRPKFVHLYIVGLVYGVVLENSGIVAGFFSEEGYRFYIPGIPAPVYAMVGWCTAIYVSVHVTEVLAAQLGRGWLAISVRCIVATALALSIDLQVDPAATYCGWWVWHPGLGQEILGVPSINFIAWFAALLPFFWTYFWYTDRPDRAARVQIRPMAGSAACALALAAGLVIGLTVLLLGTDSTSWHLFTRALTHPIRTILH